MDRKISLKYGLMAGGSVVLYFLLFYFLDKENLFKMWVASVSLIIYVIFMAKAVSDQRTAQEDIISLQRRNKCGFSYFYYCEYCLLYFLLF